MVNDNSDVQKRTLSTKRIFNAPIETVWKVWSEAEHLKNWWGPKGFSITNNKHEFKKDGAWSLVMHGPNGVDYPNELVYGKIEYLKSIELHHISNPKFTVTALFNSIGPARTQVEFIQTFDEQKTCDAVKDFAIIGNVEHQIRFEAELAKITKEVLPIEFVISREFNADLETMWKMFTDPESMASWYGPKDIKIGHREMNFHRGGYYHFCMVASDGNESWGKVYYIDIVDRTRLIYVTTFSNKNGEITRHPMAPLIPAELLTTINFIEVGNGKTKIETKWIPINALPEEIKFFNEMHESFNMGWTGSLDRLEAILN